MMVLMFLFGFSYGIVATITLFNLLFQNKPMGPSLLAAVLFPAYYGWDLLRWIAKRVFRL